MLTHVKNGALIPAPISRRMSIDSEPFLDWLKGTTTVLDDSVACTAKDPPAKSVSENKTTLRMIQPGFCSLIVSSHTLLSIDALTFMAISSAEGGAAAAIYC